MTASPSGTTFKAVFEDERKIIESQRKNRDDTSSQKDPEKLTGLAISGGGIRSASFALGVLQSLNVHNELRSVDYLSTVSGGGYIGASLTWFNYINKKTSPSWQFPFEIGAGTKQETVTGEQKVIRQEEPLNFLRQNANYLLPNGISSLSLVGVLLRNMTLSISVYLAVIVTILYLNIGLFQPRKWVLPFTESWPQASAFTQGAGIIVILFGITTFIYAWMTWLPNIGTREIGYRIRVSFQKLQGMLIFFAFAFGLLALIPLALTGFNRALDISSYMTGYLPTILGIIGAIYEFIQQQKGNQANKGPLTEVRILLTSLLLIFGIGVIGYKLALDWNSAEDKWLLGMIIGVILLAGWFVNINLFGIGRMSRDRLMEAFLPNWEAVGKNQWGLATKADEAFFTHVSGADQWGPYHIINTNVVLVDAHQNKFRGRGGDNFMMSHLYCGGDAIGYHSMAEFEGGEITLATAVSISGAALNPNAANSGQGTSRNRLVSFILGFLNIRLGFWVRNPTAAPLRKFMAKWNGPNFFYPGFLQGLLGTELNETASYLQLTDGGHFDNTGLYELIRRRVDTIYFSSAGADPDFTLDDVGSILLRMQIDFGVTIDFDDELEPLMPGTYVDCPYGKRFFFSQSGFSMGKINYPESEWGPAKTGTIFMIRATLVKDLPIQIYSYRAQHGEFPNESTQDQFYDETQLEAYRELGLKLTDQMFKSQKKQESIGPLSKAIFTDQILPQ
ncbi:MAG: hypothetical protein ACXWTK_03200 [Methylobacter sp.]